MEGLEIIVEVGKLFLAGAFMGAVSAYLGFRDKHAATPSEKLDGEKVVMTTVRQAVIGGITMAFALGALQPEYAVLVSALVAVGGDTIGRRLWAVLKEKVGESTATDYVDRMLS